MMYFSGRLKTDHNWRSRGFTLLELLVALSIMSMIMAAAFGAVRLGSRSFEAGVTRANETGQIRASTDFLRRQFAQLVPIVHKIDAETEISFSADREQIRFIAPAPGFERRAGLYIYKLMLESGAGGRRLLISYAAYDPGTDDFVEIQNGRQTLLATNLADAYFEYFGQPDDEADLAWYDVWSDEAAYFPQIVRIHTVPGMQTDWPELTFVIRAEEST